ncbi:hypothetical protein [Brassicibacter mesophilus]|uniref:hypothetical protein n=1 Tax=Brassicibacter mesophilus TaxID=745119 RepID=UPI003D25B065
MIDNSLKNFIMNGCYGEVKRYNRNMQLYSFGDEEYATGQWTYVVELMIITAKSLIPSMDKCGTIIDYNRFNEELKLWTYYRHGKSELLLNAACSKNDENYWTNIDDSINSRIVPIVAANECWDVIIDEVITNVLFTSGNINTLLESIMLSKLLYLLFESNNRTPEDIISHLKEEIIRLSQKQFLIEYQEFFRLPIEKYSGNYSIDFERNRIDIISLLNGVANKDKYYTLSNCLDIINRAIDMDDRQSFFINGINGLILNTVESNEIKDREFIQSLCSYLIKLRKGRIASERLTKSSYNNVDIFSYSKGDVFVHPLLNKCMVVNRREKSNMIISYINSKSGIYRFLKRKK